MTTADEAPGRRIVVGFDGSASARAAFDWAIGGAGPADVVYVVVAYDPPSRALGGQTYDDAAAALRADARGVVDGLEDVPRRCRLEIELLEGPAGEAIARVADVRHATEVALGSRGRGRIARLLGSTCEDVLHRASCPVLVVPAGAVGHGADRTRQAAATR